MFVLKNLEHSLNASEFCLTVVLERIDSILPTFDTILSSSLFETKLMAEAENCCDLFKQSNFFQQQF